MTTSASCLLHSGVVDLWWENAGYTCFTAGSRIKVCGEEDGGRMCEIRRVAAFVTVELVPGLRSQAEPPVMEFLPSTDLSFSLSLSFCRRGVALTYLLSLVIGSQ